MEQTKNQLFIEVRGKIATLTNQNFQLVGGNNDYEVVFEFDEAWESHKVKTALFVFADKTVEQVFEGNICNGVAIENSTMCLVGVVTGDIATTTPALISDIKLSIRDVAKGVPQPPTQDVYNQIMALLNRYINESRENNTVGSKAFKVIKRRYIFTAGWIESGLFLELDSVQGLEEGMLVSVRLGGNDYVGTWSIIRFPNLDKYPNVVQLSRSDYNKLTVVEGDYLKVIGRADLGTFIIDQYSTASGGGNLAGNSYTDAGGRVCVADGKYSFTRGSTNVAGYLAAVFGSGNNIYGEASLGTGKFNTAKPLDIDELGHLLGGFEGFIFGRRNNLNHPRSIVGGYQNETDRSNEAVFGAISAPVADALLKIGNGAENNDGTFSRSNAFVVHADGRITAGKDASDDMDLPNIKQVKTMIPKVTEPAIASNGNFKYYPSNVNLLDYIVSNSVALGQTSIEAAASNGVTGLPSGTVTLRCLVTKSSAGLIWVQGFRYDGAIFSTVYDVGSKSWSTWVRLG